METTLPREASARLQKMLKEAHAEAQHGFGGKSAPWLRTLGQLNALGATDRLNAAPPDDFLSTEVEAMILNSFEAVLGDLSRNDPPKPPARREDEAACDNQGDYVTAILIQSIASAILTDDQIRADSDQRSNDEPDADFESVHRDIEECIRQAFEADTLQSKRGPRFDPDTGSLHVVPRCPSMRGGFMRHRRRKPSEQANQFSLFSNRFP